MDELFEALTLVQTKRINPFPIVVIGKAYWKGLMAWLEKTMLLNGCISRSDLKIFTVAETPEEVIEAVKKFYKKAR